MSIRSIAHVRTAQPTIEGAGVQLRRCFGFPEQGQFDPFLLFDDFSSDVASDYLPGFPPHPHRGMETVTYIIKGTVHHKDSLSHEGYIGPGDIQWMTAGSGIVHEEMPQGVYGIVGFQLWVNLPSSHKMMQPRYQEIRADRIPTVHEPGVCVHVIAGNYHGTHGPVEDIVVAPLYLDIILDPHTTSVCTIQDGDTCFAYVIDGSLTHTEQHIEKHSLVQYAQNGTTVELTSGKEGARVLLASGTPLKEPIAWHGPIVMNTREEIQHALHELRSGTFIQHRPS